MGGNSKKKIALTTDWLVCFVRIVLFGHVAAAEGRDVVNHDTHVLLIVEWYLQQTVYYAHAQAASVECMTSSESGRLQWNGSNTGYCCNQDNAHPGTKFRAEFLHNKNE